MTDHVGPLVGRVAIGAALVSLPFGSTYGVMAAWSYGDIHTVQVTERQPYVQVENAAPGSTDAQFNALASQVHRVSIIKPAPIPGVPYTDTRPATVAGYHQLVGALVDGKLGNDPRRFMLAANAGKNLSHDLAARESGSSYQNEVDVDTTVLTAKLKTLAPNLAP